VRHIVALLTALTTMLSALAIGCGGAFAQDGMADVSVAGAPDVLALRTTPQDVLIAGDNICGLRGPGVAPSFCRPFDFRFVILLG
jgi:hypothetical protein